MVGNLFQKEICLKYFVKDKIKNIQKIFNCSERNASDFYMEVFLSRFLGFNHKFSLKYIYSIVKKKNFENKKTLEATDSIIELLSTENSDLELFSNKITNQKVNYTNNYLHVEYLYENTPFQESILIPEKIYYEVFQNTKEKSFIHTNLIFLRYFYIFYFWKNHLAYENYDDLKNQGYKLECFASSFNRSLPYFCALYEDIDSYSNGYFGNFIDLTPEKLINEIKWENNHIKLTFHPPYYSYLILLSITKLYTVLFKCKNKYNYSFTVHVLIPHKEDLIVFIKHYKNFWNIYLEHYDKNDYSYLNKENDTKSFISVDTAKLILTSK